MLHENDVSLGVSISIKINLFFPLFFLYTGQYFTLVKNIITFFGKNLINSSLAFYEKQLFMPIFLPEKLSSLVFQLIYLFSLVFFYLKFYGMISTKSHLN